MDLIVREAKSLCGSCEVPSDKSISHRALMLSALANSKSVIHNLLRSQDVLSTLTCLQDLGFQIVDNGTITIHPMNESLNQDLILDCGNSGTTMRLLCGLLAPMKVAVVLDGDSSLRRRPMKRVAEPLGQLGARIEVQENGCAPIRIHPSSTLSFADVSLPVASAQLKSACLLLGLQGNGCIVRGGGNSRDHTERMLNAMGASLQIFDNGDVQISKGSLNGFEMTIPGDFSSAAFILSAGLLLPNSKLTITGVNLNPTRTGLLDVLQRMGAKVCTTVTDAHLEPVGEIEVQSSHLHGCVIPQEMNPRLIDELPLIAVLATQATGQTEIRGAEELRYKESDRISATVEMLHSFGAVVHELNDGLIINGPQQLVAGHSDSKHDHRIAMAAAVAALCAQGESRISNADCISVSFPGFSDLFSRLGAVMKWTEGDECFE